MLTIACFIGNGNGLLCARYEGTIVINFLNHVFGQGADGFSVLQGHACAVPAACRRDGVASGRLHQLDQCYLDENKASLACKDPTNELATW